MEKVRKFKVIRVDRNEFELENGQVFEHIEPLECVPSLDEFQSIYDECCENMNKIMEKHDHESR